MVHAVRQVLQPVCRSNNAIRCLFSAVQGTNHNHHRYQHSQNSSYGKSTDRKYGAVAALFGVAAAAAGTAGCYYYSKKEDVVLKAFTLENGVGAFRDGLPEYTSDDVASHGCVKDRVWVSFKHGVYDITDFIQEHPGGDKILLGAGGSVEPFWMLYAVHKSPHVLALLEQYRIGNLDPKDVGKATRDMNDPYGTEPIRHPALKPTSERPFNAETPPELLVENFITPNSLFYVRNHLPVPEVDIESYELEIEGPEKEVIFKMDDIKKLPKHSVTTTVMCAGNRRNEMTKVKDVKGLGWGHGAVGTATWSGARLRDVLCQAGLSPDKIDDAINHVHFEGMDTDPTSSPYAASIPIEKALDPRGDVILAYEMNGEPIPRDHGFPLRAIVPGVVGARNVKWLGRIALAEEEVDSHWQQKDYKGFSPCTSWETVDYSKSPSIQELPVTSAVCSPADGEKVKPKEGVVPIQGYAWSGGGRKIIRVDVSVDGGKTWHVANLKQDASKDGRAWAWSLWDCKVPVPEGANKINVVAKAVDSAYNVQPESFGPIWNLRGLLGNAYHRVSIEVDKSR